MNKILRLSVPLLFSFLAFSIAAPSAFAASENITQINFTTSSQTIVANATSTVLTTQTQNLATSSEEVSETTTLNLNSTSETGQFSNANETACTGSFNNGPFTLTMSSSTANKHFCYKDSTPGTYTLTISASVGGVAKNWAPAVQTITINSNEGGGGNGGGPNYVTIFGGIKTTLSGQGVTTNIDTCASTPTGCSGLYFEKTDKGRVTFSASLDLTASSTADFLQSLGSKMKSSAGSMKFDAQTAYLLKNAGAQIAIYGLNGLGFTGVPNIVVKNDTGTVIPSTDSINYPLLSGISYDATANDGTLTFSSNHFTAFETKKVLNTTTGVGYDTIQAAVTAANSGDTIRIAAGTYEQGTTQIAIDKSLTLEGPNAAISPNGGTRVAEAIIHGSASGGTATFNITSASARVTFQGLEFENMGATMRSDASGSTISLNKNIFTGSMADGMGFDGPNLTVDDNLFTSIDTPNSDLIQIWVSNSTTAGTVSFTNNYFTSITSSGGLNLSDVHGTISGNHFSSVQYYGVLVNANVNLSITDNVFDYISNPDPSMSNTWGAGIRFYDDTNPATVASITDNIFSNSYLGISIKPAADIAGASISAHGNTFNNNDLAIRNAGTGTLDATNNYWGTSVPDFGAVVNGTITYDPWYLDEEMTNLSSSVDKSTVYVDDNYTSGGANDGHYWGLNAFSTIQGAINAVDAGGTVNVSAGTYNEGLSIAKSLTLHSISGAASTIINGGDPYSVTITSKDVTIDGFTVTNPSYSGTSDASGIVVEPSTYVSNANIKITNNVIHDIGTPTRTSVSYGTCGINLGFATGVEIADNEIYNIIHNDPNAWANGICIWGGDSTTPANDISIHDNSFHNISSPYPVNAAISTQTDVGSVTVYHNSIVSTNGVEVRSTNTIDATNNWWGSSVLETIQSKISGMVTINSWYTDSGMTKISYGATTNAVVSSSQEGQANLPAGTTEIELSDATVLDLSSGILTIASEDESIGGNTVTLTQSVILQSGTNDEPVVLTNSNLADVSASIPDGTTIKGPAGWDGTIQPPMAIATSGSAPAGFSVGDTVISIGSPDGTLVFDNPVTILLAGVTGDVGYKPAGSDTWIQITNVCSGSYNTPNAPIAPGECAISNGIDTKIVTYHFTSFGGLNKVVSPSVPVSSGGSSGGSRSTCGYGFVWNPSTMACVQNVATVLTPAIPVQGQVLGAAVYSFTKDLSIGARGTDVTALQQFLIDSGYAIPAGATGYFGAQTKTAVIAFQKTHNIVQTGSVGPLTRTELDKGSLGFSGFTALQANAIAAVLSAFGVDGAAVNKARSALTK